MKISNGKYELKCVKLHMIFLEDFEFLQMLKEFATFIEFHQEE